MKGDQIETVLAVGDKVERILMKATKAGESVEVNRSATRVEVVVNDRNGNPKRTATFQSAAVIATIEHPHEPDAKPKIRIKRPDPTLHD